ncbi:MAG: bifunctional hydroxymethylpyrimidine kinase/phosphomethylpyrimidine kinase, partial [Porcipelethomonas sp.]
KALAASADILTPNITEACFLTDTPYTGEDISIETAEQLIKKIYSVTNAQTVLTGIIKSDKIINMTFDGRDISLNESARETKVFSGTGDIFASVVCAFTVKGRPLHEAVDIAGRFISSAIERTVLSGEPLSEGVIFEPLLCRLGTL